MIKKGLVIALVLALPGAAWAYDYGYDADKATGPNGHSGYFMELAQDPVALGGGLFEYVVDLYDTGYMTSGIGYDIWGFDNAQITNQYPMSGYITGDNVSAQCWDGYSCGPGRSWLTLQPPSYDPDGDDLWDLTAETWAIGNPWHLPSEYLVYDFGQGGFAYHTGDSVDIGDPYRGGTARDDVIPIYQYWNSTTGATGLLVTVRVVTTELFGSDPGDSPIPEWTPWNDATSVPIGGYWDAVGGVPGDFTGEGDVNAADIDILCDNMGLPYDPLYDLDNGTGTGTPDGVVDDIDLIYHIEELVEWDNGVDTGEGTKQGDFNLDGVVNATDLAIMKGTFGASGVGYADGNANCDDVVNATDLAILKGSFGFIAPTGGGVPEPLSIVLLSAGGLALLRRKRR